MLLPNSQYSFGHLLVNTLMTLFLMLSNHVQPQELPPNLQVLFAAGAWSGAVLPVVARATLSPDVHLLPQWLRNKQQDGGLAGVCFRCAPLPASTELDRACVWL